MPIPERTGQSENRMDAAFDLSLRVRGTQAVSNETSQTRGAEESAPVVTAKKSANFAAHEVHGSVAHKGSARWSSGQSKLRRIDGWRKIATVPSQHTLAA